MEERRKEKERKDEEDARFWQDQKEEEARWEMAVKEERRRMIKDHATKLVGFLPPSVLQEEDLEYLDSEVRKAFAGDGGDSWKDPLAKLEEVYYK